MKLMPQKNWEVLFILARITLHVIITNCIRNLVHITSITHLLDLQIPDSKLNT